MPAGRDLRRLARRMAAAAHPGHRELVAAARRHGEQPVWAGHGAGRDARARSACRAAASATATAPWPTSGERRADAALPALPQGPNPVRAFIPVARIADMLLHPGEPYEYDGARRHYPDIRLVYWCGGNPFHHHQDLNRLRRALGRPETVVVHEPFWTAIARHADIVLPATMTLERNDIGAGRNDRYLIAMHRAIEPFGQARDDYRHLRRSRRRGSGVARRASPRAGTSDSGCATSTTAGVGSWPRRGARSAGVRRVLGRRRGPLPDPDARRRAVLLADFRADPAAHRLGTPSGSIEIFSATIAGFGYDDCPGHPVWLEPDRMAGRRRGPPRVPART